MIWTITGKINGVHQTQTFEQLKLAAKGASIVYKSQTADVFEVDWVAPYGAVIPFVLDVPPANEWYTVSLDGVPQFIGRCKDVTPSSLSVQHGLHFVFTGPLQDFEEENYTESWKFNTKTEELSKILFFIDELGHRTNTADTIRAVMTKANGLGSPLILGDISDLDAANIQPPQYVAIAPLLADMMRQCLLWSPEIATSVDYRSGTPVLNFTPRGGVELLPFAIGAGLLQSVVVKPRPDLVPSGIVIKYIYANAELVEADGTIPLDVTIQSAGATSGRKVLPYTFELQPGSSSGDRLEQKIVTEKIPDDLTDIDFAQDWWEDRTGLWDIDQIDSITELEEDRGSTDTLPLNFRLVEGTIQDWMKDPQGGVPGASFYSTAYAKARLLYTFTDANGISHQKAEVVTIPMTTTNVASRTFTKVANSSGTSPEEPPPVNLAQLLYDQMKVMHYDGEITLRGVSGFPKPGMVCNVRGGRPEWQTMNAQIQQVKVDIGAVKTILRVGPPTHLAIQDWKTLTEPMRVQWSNGTVGGGSRTSADQQPGATIPGGQGVPKGGATPITSTYSRFHVVDPDGGGDNIISSYSNKDDLEQTLVQMFRDNCYQENYIDSDDESSSWWYNANGAVVNIKVTCKDKQIIIWNEASGLTCYLKPDGVVVTSDDDQIYGQFITDGEDFSFWGYNADGNGNQIKYSTEAAGKLQVWNESSGKMTSIEPGSITLTDDSGNTRTMGTKTDEMDAADGSAWELNGTSLTLTDAAGNFSTLSTTSIELDKADGASFFANGAELSTTSASGDSTSITGAVIDQQANSGKEIYLDPANLTKGSFASFKVTDVCNSGADSQLDFLRDS